MKTMSRVMVLFLFSFQAFAQNIFLQPIAKSSFQKSAFWTAKITSTGNLLALSGADKSIKVVDAMTLTEKFSFQNEYTRTYSLVFTADGKNLITSTPDGKISVWDFTNSIPIRTFSLGQSIRCIDIDHSGRLVSGGFDKTIKMFDYITGTQIGKFPSVNAEIIALSFSADGNNFAAGCSNGTITIFNTNSSAVSKTLENNKTGVLSLAYSSDGKYFAASYKDSTISLYDAKSGVLFTSIKNSDGIINSLVFHPNNKCLISTSASILFWEVPTGKILKTVSDTAFFPVMLTIGQQQPILAVVGRNGEVRTYRVLDKKQDTTAPVIIFSKPQVNSNEPVRAYTNEIDIEGTVSDESQIQNVTLNGTSLSTISTSPKEQMEIDNTFSTVSFSTTALLPSAGLNTLVFTATDAENNTLTQKLQVMKLSKDALVELVFPKENLETDQVAIDFQFKIWLDFTTYSVMLNTVEVSKKDNLPRKQSGFLRTEKLSLSSGINQIQLIVNGRDGEKIRKTLNVTRRMLSAPSTISEEKRKTNTAGQPQRWAVIVGVSEYSNPEIKNLTYADRDARSFAEFLKTPSGGSFEEERVKILLNKEATLQNIKQALYNFLRQTVETDLVVIYFAGHGAPEPANPNNNYLLCYDTDPKSLETTAFPMWDVNTALTRYIPSKRVVIFTDACHSGGINTDLATRGLNASNDNLINQYLADLAKTKEGIIVFTASQAGEVSQELEKFGHGVFTYFLLEGMEGKADFNNDYTVTIGELMDYVEEKVKRQTNGNQHPTRNQGTYDKELTISLIAH